MSDDRATPIPPRPDGDVVTYDRWQDGRIRAALVLGAVGLLAAALALALNLRRVPPPVRVDCPAAAACPACPTCPQCPAFPERRR